MKIFKAVKAQYSNFKAIRLNTPLMSRILFVSAVLLIASFFINVKMLVFLITATAFNTWLAGFQIKRGLPTDFELSTFATVLTTVVFGIKWGIFIAIFSKLFSCIATGSVVVDHFFMIATYINAAVFASILSGMPIFMLGLMIVAMNCVIMFLISKNMGIDITANLAYTVTNFIFNFIVFSIFSQAVLGLLR